MAFSLHPDFKESDLTSTVYCESQLKAAVAEQKFVKEYEHELNNALNCVSPDDSIATYLSKESIQTMSRQCGATYQLALFGFQTLLANRRNPNQPDPEMGLVPLWWLNNYDENFLMLAFAYGADPRLIPNRKHREDLDEYFSSEKPVAPIQWIISLKFSAHYNFIVKHCIKPQQTPNAKMQIFGYTIKTKNDRKFIYFETNKGQFTNKIVPTKLLTPEELRIIYDHYKKYFKASPALKGTLDQFFLHEIQGQSKLVELFYCGDKFFGMHLHKTFKDPRYPSCVSHYISCAYLEDVFRGLGWSDPLMMTLPSLMPKLFKGKLVVGSLQAIFIGGAKLLKGLECFPKYRSEFLARYANDHFAHVQEKSALDPNPVLTNNRPGECSSALPVRPIADAKINHDELSLEEIFFNWQRGIYCIKNIGTETHRGVFFVFPIDDEFILKYFNSCAKLKLHGGRFLNDVAPHVAELLPELKPQFEKDALFLPQHGMLFQNVVVPSKTKIPPSRPVAQVSKI